MTDLDLIRSLRADVAPPTANAIAAAERAWREPRAKRATFADLAARPGRFALAAVLAAATALAVALILPVERDGRLGTPEAGAAEMLRLAAKADQGGLTRPLRPGEYWYVRQRTTWNGAPRLREDWIAADGSRRWRMAGETHEVGPSRRAPFFLGVTGMTYAQLLALPRDPEALYDRVHAAAVACACGNANHAAFATVSDLLRDAPVPNELRSALLRAAARIPGIELVESVRDVAGRTGVGVASGANVLVFDRRTHELLGENRGRQGSAIVRSAIVGSSRERPRRRAA